MIYNIAKALLISSLLVGILTQCETSRELNGRVDRTEKTIKFTGEINRGRVLLTVDSIKPHLISLKMENRSNDSLFIKFVKTDVILEDCSQKAEVSSREQGINTVVVDGDTLKMIITQLPKTVFEFEEFGNMDAQILPPLSSAYRHYKLSKESYERIREMSEIRFVFPPELIWLEDSAIIKKTSMIFIEDTLTASCVSVEELLSTGE